MSLDMPNMPLVSNIPKKVNGRVVICVGMVGGHGLMSCKDHHGSIFGSHGSKVVIQRCKPMSVDMPTMPLVSKIPKKVKGRVVIYVGMVGCRGSMSCKDHHVSIFGCHGCKVVILRCKPMSLDMPNMPLM
jgi:hypothetical protein